MLAGQLNFLEPRSKEKGGCSQLAASEIGQTVEQTRRECYLCFIQAQAKGLTADEVAQRLNLSVLSVRPRVSELNKFGWIVKTGERRKNASGMSAAVWRVK